MESYIDYTARDYSAIKEVLAKYLQQKAPDHYTDFTESGLGIALLELIAYTAEILSFSLDRMAQESYLSTARERRNVLRIAQSLGYTPGLAIASSVDLIVNTADLLDSTGTPYGVVTIPKGTQVLAGDIVFETDIEYVLTASGGSNWLVNGVGPVTQPIVSAIQGETRTFDYVGTGEYLQSIVLPSYPVISNSISVVVDGISWTQVESLALGDPDNQSNRQLYQVSIDENDKATIKLGDDSTSDVISNGSAVEVTYRIGGGVKGNVATRVISGGLASDADGNPISVNVYNLTPATGGADREDIDRIKFFAPLYVKTNDRAITVNDYKTLSASFSSPDVGKVAKSGVIADPSDGISNVVSVYLWSEDNDGLLQPASGALREAVRLYLEDRRVVTVMVTVEPGVNVDITATVHVRVSTNYNEQALQQKVAESWDALIASPRVRQNNELRYSWILEEINSIPGVDWVHLTQLAFVEPTEGDNMIGPLNFSARSFGYKNYPPAGDLDQVIDLNGDVVIFSVDENNPDNPVPVFWGDGTTPIYDIEDYYCNYSIRITLSNGQTEIRRIVQYTAEIEDTNLGRVFVRRAVVESDFSVIPQPGDPFEIFHPRLIRFADSEETDTAIDQKYKHRVIYTSQGIGLKQSRTIINFDPIKKVATIDEDWTVYPEGVISGNQTKGLIYPDIRVKESEAIVSTNGLNVILRQDEVG